MEQNTNAGVLKLSQRILDEAKANAVEIETEAKAKLDAQAAQLEKQKTEIKAEYLKKRNELVEGILDGAKTRASIDGRKNALQMRREKIEAAYSSAYESIIALSREESKKLLMSLLIKETEGGETVIPAAADRALLGEIVNELADKKLVLADCDAEVERGCILNGGSYEKDCSFKAILNELRAETETDVSKLLFD